jgi:hypothetical protein
MNQQRRQGTPGERTRGRVAGPGTAEPLAALEQPLDQEVVAALAGVAAARADVERSLDGLTDAAKRAVDLPAKVRRNPLKSAALVGGTGFLLAGGPRRALRFALARVRPPREELRYGLLPDEIEKVLKDHGLAKDPQLRRALDEDFAEYLRRKGKVEPEPTAAASLWRTFDRVAGPLGTAGARVLVQRLMSAEAESSARRSEARAEARRRAREAASGDPRSEDG